MQNDIKYINSYYDLDIVVDGLSQCYIDWYVDGCLHIAYIDEFRIVLKDFIEYERRPELHKNIF